MTDTPKLRLVGWPEENPRPGCDPLGLYSETYWLPQLCPTAFVLGRRMVALIRRHEARDRSEPLMVSRQELAYALGVGSQWDPASESYIPSLSIYTRAEGRLSRFNLVQLRGQVIEIKLRWPRLNSKTLARMPEAMQHAEPDFWGMENAAPMAPNFVSI